MLLTSFGFAYKDLSQVPLPEDPLVEEKAQGEQVGKEEVSSSFYDLLVEIETHTANADVIIIDNLNPLRTV